MLFFGIILSIILAVSTVLTFRLISLLPDFERSQEKSPLTTTKPKKPIRIVIVLGSGGHTAEMLALLKDLDTTRYTHRSYVVSGGDAFSAQKAMEFERQLELRHAETLGSYDITVVPRARRVHQSLATTPFTSLYCLWSCISLLRKPDLAKQHLMYPDVVITNGPGTGVIVVAACYLIRLLGIRGYEGKMRTVYVESFARVKRLSLSGKILLPLVNRFIVQWETLAKTTGGKAEYLGVLI